VNPWVLEKMFAWSPGIVFEGWEEVAPPPFREAPRDLPVVACVDEP
jgi:hypothetical protein